MNLGSLQLPVDSGFSPAPKDNKKPGLDLFKKYLGGMQKQRDDRDEWIDPWTKR